VKFDSPTSPAAFCLRDELGFFLDYCGTSLLTAETCKPPHSEISSRSTKCRVVPGAVIPTLRESGQGLPK